MFEEKGYLTSAQIDIIVHEPIETKDIGRKEEKALAEKVEKIIKDGIKELQDSES